MGQKSVTRNMWILLSLCPSSVRPNPTTNTVVNISQPSCALQQELRTEARQQTSSTVLVSPRAHLPDASLSSALPTYQALRTSSSLNNMDSFITETTFTKSHSISGCNKSFVSHCGAHEKLDDKCISVSNQKSSVKFGEDMNPLITDTFSLQTKMPIKSIKECNIEEPSNFSSLSQTNPFLCFQCNMDFYDEKNWNEHRKEKEFICRVCSAKLTGHTELEDHIATHSLLYCPICKRPFLNKNDVFCHRQQSVSCGLKLKCKFCSKFFSNKTSLYLHNRTYHDDEGLEGKFECVVCLKSYNMWCLLNQHLKNYHCAYEFIECIHCKKTLLGPERLKLHIKVNHSEISKIVYSKNRLINHNTSKHENIKKIQSGIDTQLKCKRNLKLAAKRSLSSEIQHCEICEMYFETRTILENHLRTHSHAKPYKCETCGSSFKAKYILVNHERSHCVSHINRGNTCGLTFKEKQPSEKCIKKCRNIKEDKKRTV